MKSIQILLAVVVVTCASGAIWSAYPGEAADHPSVTLYTPSLAGESFICTAVNASHETLDMVFTILNVNGVAVPDPGNPFSTPSLPPEAVGVPQAPISASPPVFAYCKVEVFGTENRNDVRVNLIANLTRTVPGTDIPVYVFRNAEGH